MNIESLPFSVSLALFVIGVKFESQLKSSAVHGINCTCDSLLPEWLLAELLAAEFGKPSKGQNDGNQC